MAISFSDITNKVINWIKANGNREITAEQLNEILIDVINALIEEVPEGGVPFLNENGFFEGGAQYQKSNGKLSVSALALAAGASLVNYIHNNGAFLGTSSRALITKHYHDLFHKTTQWADIVVVTTANPPNLKSGDTVDGQTLEEGQIMLVMNPTGDMAANGIFIVGAEGSSKMDTYLENTNINVTVLSPTQGRGHSYILGKDNDVTEGQVPSDEIAGYIKIASQLTILNL